MVVKCDAAMQVCRVKRGDGGLRSLPRLQKLPAEEDSRPPAADRELQGLPLLLHTAVMCPASQVE